jgi:hypothetical protein
LKAEQLLILASVRGIDLGLSRPKRDIPLAHKGPPKRRDVRAPKTLGEDDPGDPGIPGVLSAEGKQTRTSRQPEWTARDLGIAAQGMPDISWRALCWVVGGEEQSRIYLKAELLRVALERKQRESWPSNIKRGDCRNCGCVRSTQYVEDLCTLAVSEMAQLGMSEVGRAQFFGLAEHNWRRHVMKLYQPLYAHAQSWYQDGIRYLQSRLSAREKSPEAA